MLMTIEGLYENGAIRLLEPLPGITRARVAITVLPEPASTETTPMDMTLSAEDRAVWEEFPAFRAAHPLDLNALKGQP